MNKNVVTWAICACLVLPEITNAAQIVGETLEIYGKAHVSLDSVSAKDSTDNKSVDNLSVSSNSSRLGFKGKFPVGNLSGIYKIEGSLSFENSGGEIDHRAAYAGVQDGFGTLIAGYRDTPFKDIRGKFDLFGDTVGDARNIIGSIDDSNLFDKRAKNAIMWTSPNMNGLQTNIMYSTAWEANTTAQEGQDNNHNTLASLNVLYKANNLALAAGWEQQKHVDGSTTGHTTYESTGTRLVGVYHIDMLGVGLIYENLDDDKTKANRRSAYGLNVSYKMGKGKIKAQYLSADKNDAVKKSGATEIAVGYDYKLADNSSTYIMYSTINNDDNADYVIDNGHDQKYTTATGKNVSALSAGYILSF